MNDNRHGIELAPAILAGGIRSDVTGREVTTDALVAAINDSVAAGRMTLFVGAGASFDAGLPAWGVLLERLSADLLRDNERDAFTLLARLDSPLVIARYLRAQLKTPSNFHTHVRAALYKGDVDYGRANPTLDLILAIAKLAKRQGVALDIVTYNFDDLIEWAVRARLPALTVASVVNEPDWHCARADVRVLHVHGLLPQRGEVPVLPPPPLVLSEDSFHRLMNDPHAWQNRCQADAFAWRDCLFLGLSLADPNLRRVIDYATAPNGECAGQRWVVARRYQAGDEIIPGDNALDSETATALNSVRTRIYNDLAAEVRWIDGYEELRAMALALTSFG